MRTHTLPNFLAKPQYYALLLKARSAANVIAYKKLLQSMELSGLSVMHTSSEGERLARVFVFINNESRKVHIQKRIKSRTRLAREHSKLKAEC